MLWCALLLPSLPLDVFARAWTGGDASRRFVVASGGNAPQVVAANAPAQAAGIRRGQAISAALARPPDVVLRDRNPDAEAPARAPHATRMLRFTSRASIAPPDAVVADIEGSLRLFGGLPRLAARLAEGVRTQGYDPRLGLAPTPTAALVLARAGCFAPVRDPRELLTALGPLPLRTLDVDPGAQAALAAAGVTTLGQADALPRDALARRCGTGLVARLDRAFARCPDPCVPYVPPPRFASRLDLPAPADDIEALAFGVNRLVHELASWLAARGLGVRRLTLTLAHEHYLRRRGIAPTLVPFALGAAARAPAHLAGVLRERLVRVTLPAPVEAIALASEETAPLPGRSLGLLPGDEAAAVPVPLVDRLRARLGDDAVATFAPHAEHRPERALRDAPSIAPSRAVAGKDLQRAVPLPDAPRPLWLLPEAQPLGPMLERTPWALKDGPERIESGWWDGDDVRRDYFVAETPHGELVWIYRDHRYGTDDGEWFLHGLFA
jgi:protein ImuB